MKSPRDTEFEIQYERIFKATGATSDTDLARGEVDGMIRDEVIEALRNRYTKDHIAAVAKDCVEKYANSYWFRSELKEEAVKQVGTIVESERNAIRAVINENKQIAFEEANIEKIVRRVLKNKFS